MSQTRTALSLALGCCLVVLLAVHAPVLEPEPIAAPAAIPSPEPCLAIDAPLPATAEVIAMSAVPSRSALEQAVFNSCTPPAGCPTPELYCDCIASGYSEWVCAWYGC